jgi:hypothetical protein
MATTIGANKGQADHVLAAFRYQLLRSLDAWLGLRADEVLWLEIEEDFSVVSADAATHIQVKHSVAAAGPKPRSLHSSDVCDVLRRYWVRSNQGLDNKSQVAFIANSGAAREQKLTFPANAPGLEYWGIAALDADTAPIREALATVFAGEPIGEWIAGTPSDEELRARLLRRVQWILNALDAAPLNDLIRDKLAEIYFAKGLWVTLADESVHGLLSRVFETASARQADDRQLTAIDLHRCIELAAAPTAALQNSARMFSGAVEDSVVGGIFVSPLLPPPANITDRGAAVQEIRARVRGEPVIWLHGTHGVGKSTLARLIALQIGGSWLGLDLRSVQEDARAALSAWRELLRALLRDPQVDGIVIDDLAGPALDALRPRLLALIASVAPRGIRVIVNSSYAPSAARLTDLGASPNAAIQAPYFTEEDVRALVTSQNPPPEEMIEGWTRLIHVTTNGGHPLLVAVKVSSLRSRAWPTSAFLEDIGPRASEALQTTRDEFRRRMLDEIPSSEARQLLRRLGCVFDRADDALIMKLAQGEPPIQNAGDALAVLRGSWIEVIPLNDLRLSPLIANIGQDVLEQERLQWRRIAAEHWLSMRVLDERTLPLCFWNAFWGKHTGVLARLCEIIQTLSGERLRAAAALLSPMTVLVTDRSIYSEIPAVAVMLRLLQFEVANAVEDGETADRAARRLLVEIDAVEHEELRLLEASIAIPKVLLAEHANISPTFQLDCALRLRAVLQRIAASDMPELKKVTASITNTFDPDIDMAGFLFAVVVTHIRSSAGMLAMIEALDALNEADRNSFLDGAALSLGQVAGSFVHNGWAQEQLDGHDLRPALERFKQMTETAKHWGRPDLQVQLVCAQSVILDECLDDAAAAIVTVDEAMAELSSAPALIRQKAKVLGHTGDDAASARLLMSVEDIVGAGEPFDRALALRDGGVSAARAELFPDAIRLFGKAHDILMRECDRPVLAVGVQIEIALTFWAMKDRPAAIVTLADALDGVEPLDPDGSRQNERVHQFARATIGSLWQDLNPHPSRNRPNIAIGQASALTGDGPILKIDLKPLADNWRILAVCEIEMGIDAGIERRSQAKQRGPGLASIEMVITTSRYARAVATNDIDAAFRLGLAAVSASRVAAELRAAGTAEARATPAEMESKSLQMLLAEGWGEIVKTIPVDLLIWRRFQGGWDSRLLDLIDAACAAAWGNSASIADILKAASGLDAPRSDASAATALAARLNPTFDPKGNPAIRFLRDQLLVCHTAASLARRVLEPIVVTEVVEGWSRVLADEGFALRAPLEHAPAIEAAISDTRSSGLSGAARLLLAAAPATNAQPGEKWVELLRRISGS